MQECFNFRNIICAVCMAVMAVSAQAADTVLDASAISADDVRYAAPGEPAPVRDDAVPPRLTGGKVHKYLGLSTLALVGLTAMTAPDNGDGKAKSTSGIHPSLGRAAAAMAAAAATTGLLYHWKDIHMEDGIGDPDNLHALLAGAGALAMLYAVSRAPASGHGSAGILGGVAMGVAVKLTW